MTATGSGMAFRDWLTSDGAFMLSYDWLSSAGDKFIEHGHRLLGALAGMLAIGLTAVCWRCESRRWVKYYSALLLAGIVLQGALGGMRVLIDSDHAGMGRALALFHGCTGPLLFALCAAMVVVTSPGWAAQVASDATRTATARKLAALAAFTAGIAYLQLIVGAVLRHSKLMIGEHAEPLFRSAVYFHLLLALVVLVYIALLGVRCYRADCCKTLSLALLALIFVQLALGAGTWFVLYGLPRWALVAWGETHYVNLEAGAVRSAIVTAHGAVGSLIVALAAAVALRLSRLGGVGWKRPSLVRPRLLGALA